MAFIEFIKPGTRFDFVGKKWYFIGLSAVIMLVCVAYMLLNGLNFGVDFKGGTIIELRFAQDVDIGEVRSILGGAGFGNAEIKHFGNPREVLISTETTSSSLEGMESQVLEALRGKYAAGSVSVERVEMVGPRVGADLKRKGIWAAFWATLLILIYVAVRFEFRFALGAIAALVHDVVITVGIYTIAGREFTLQTLAVVLTILGYSINDTIVVDDRIRENMRKSPKMPLAETINLSVNETLSRTILTSLTVLLVVLALLSFGGAVINDFAFALIIGLISGSYSTIFIASPIVLLWKGKTAIQMRG